MQCHSPFPLGLGLLLALRIQQLGVHLLCAGRLTLTTSPWDALPGSFERVQLYGSTAALGKGPRARTRLGGAGAGDG